MDKFSKSRPGGGGGLMSMGGGSRKGTGALGRKPTRKTGVMGRGKYHHRRQDDSNESALGGGSALSMDADGPYRTHLLFPGRRDDGDSSDSGFRSRGSTIKNKILGGLGMKESKKTQEPIADASDPFFKSKQVSFVDGLEGRMFFERQERRPNSYNCDPKPGQRQRSIPEAFTDPYSPGAKTGKPGPGAGGAVRELLAAVGGQAAAPATGGNLTRTPACDPFAVNGNAVTPSGHKNSQNVMRNRIRKPLPKPKDLKEVTNDCFIIPRENLKRFLPDGIALPQEDANHPLINVMQVEDPRQAVAFQMIPRLFVNDSDPDFPEAASNDMQRSMASEALNKGKGLNCTEGFLLKNLEKDSDYPFINYFVINQAPAEAEAFYRGIRSYTFDAFNPSRCGHKGKSDLVVDLFHEVATIARPPVEAVSKRPKTDNTGYFICVYRVFKGDDGEKFERNWLFWSGARMLYKNLPKAVELRRITLHKSIVESQQHVTYILLVECANFMDHIGEAASLLPILRARICGYTGIYRVCQEV